MDQNTDPTPAEIIGRLKSNRFILGIPCAALVADLLVRSMSNFELTLVRPLETGVFIIAGLSLLLAAHFDKHRSLKTYRIEMWLALAFTLGALRDGLWAAGMDIQDVNEIDLALGVVGSVCVYYWTHRSSLREPFGRTPHVPASSPASEKISQRPPDKQAVN